MGQSAISSSVRLHPSHQLVTGSIRQIPVQGDGGSRMRPPKHWQPDPARLMRVRAIFLLFVAMHPRGRGSNRRADPVFLTKGSYRRSSKQREVSRFNA